MYESIVYKIRINVIWNNINKYVICLIRKWNMGRKENVFIYAFVTITQSVLTLTATGAR